jgi:putative DNA primase/helicase
MSSISQVVAQMADYRLPPLPAGHPVVDGKAHRFGPKKSAWYLLREITSKSGASMIGGAFGIWRGQDNGAVPVTIDWERVTPEERVAAEIKHREFDAHEKEKRQRLADAAANRAKMQWADADGSVDGHPYLVRKQITAEVIRCAADGSLLVPMRRYALDGTTLAGLQKIDADGAKRFNKGMNKIGVACLLGSLANHPAIIGVGEGYATCRSVRMATNGSLPVMVAFDAGSLLAVAQGLRRDFPAAHLLMLADDDAHLVARYIERMQDDFKVTVSGAIDGIEQNLTGTDGALVQFTASWSSDANGVAYIEVDVRSGRQIRTLKFENAGLAKATAAARAVGNASIVMPVFTARGESKWSDFNDLHVAEGMGVVTAQIDAALALIDTCPVPDSPIPFQGMTELPMPETIAEPAGISIPTAEMLLEHFSLIYPTTDVWDALRKQRLKRSAFDAWVGKELSAAWAKDGRRRTIARENLPALIGGRAIEGGAGGGKLGEMLDNITLLRGTETVWDAIGQQVMTLGAVRADYTADLTSKWQEHALRKTVEAKNLVFDPTQQADPVSCVNIFLGWPLMPKANAELVKPILALLESLCGAEDNIEDCVIWILRWLAFPLQHPGAKMQTALLMFGEKQGTGKSLLFQDVIAPIYGDYGTVASQHQLDSSFTAWRSRRLFVLFEEVLSRDDKYSHNGTLKYMITGSAMSINQKNLPERTERNHLNTVFLSNEPQPIPIELEDRRFMVIEARAKQPQEFYDAVTASIAAGGVQAFYQFLLDFPLEDFNAHTKPMMTLAKERVIEFGLNGWMSFHRSWKDGYLSAPYCSCLSEDLYTIYRRWCDKSGEKALTLCKFSGLIASREHKFKRAVMVDKKGKMTRMIFEVKQEAEKDSVDQQIERFRDLADIRGTGAQG